MSGPRLPAKAKLWAVIGLTFLVALFAAAPAAMAAPPAAQVEHHISATGELDHLSAVDHGHLGVALLHRMRLTLPALGLIFAVGLLWTLSPQHAVLVGRAPPWVPDVVPKGRDVLNRLCISRR
jgi:hypothetical protein